MNTSPQSRSTAIRAFWQSLVLSLLALGIARAAAEPDAIRILVKPKSAASLARLNAFHEASRAKILQTFPAMGNLQILVLDAGQNGKQALVDYQNSGLVEFAQLDQVGHVFNTPNDPQYLNGTLWALNNTGQSGGTPDADIDAPEGWDIRN